MFTVLCTHHFYLVLKLYLVSPKKPRPLIPTNLLPVYGFACSGCFL